MRSADVGSWPEEAAKLIAAVQERARAVNPEFYHHLADAVVSLSAAFRVLTTAVRSDGATIDEEAVAANGDGTEHPGVQHVDIDGD